MNFFLTNVGTVTVENPLLCSVIAYGIVVWGSVAKTYVRRVKSVQNHFLKLIDNKILDYALQIYYRMKQIC